MYTPLLSIAKLTCDNDIGKVNEFDFSCPFISYTNTPSSYLYTSDLIECFRIFYKPKFDF